MSTSFPLAPLAVCLLATSAAAQQPRTLSQQLEDQDKRLRILESQVRNLQNRTAYKWASLDCNTGKYDEFLFTTGALVFFASCSKIEPYLEGHRITVTIGNPHTFNFSGVKGTLYYGTDFTDALARQVEVSFPEVIRSGSWTTIQIVVNPSKVEHMRYVGLELNSQTASPAR
jgi:hypothetical protein